MIGTRTLVWIGSHVEVRNHRRVPHLQASLSPCLLMLTSHGSLAPSLRFQDYSLLLPTELLIAILSWLDHVSIMRIAHTSSTWRVQALQHDRFFRNVRMCFPVPSGPALQTIQSWTRRLDELVFHGDALSLVLIMENELKDADERIAWLACVHALARCVPICKELSLNINSIASRTAIYSQILRASNVIAPLLVDLHLNIWTDTERVNLPQDILCDRSPRLRVLQLDNCHVASINAYTPPLTGIRRITARRSTLGAPQAFFRLFPNLHLLFTNTSSFGFAPSNDTFESQGATTVSLVRPGDLQWLVQIWKHGLGYNLTEILDLRFVKRVEVHIRDNTIWPTPRHPFDIAAFLARPSSDSDFTYTESHPRNDLDTSCLDLSVTALTMPDILNLGANVADVRAKFSSFPPPSNGIENPSSHVWRTLRGRSGRIFEVLGLPFLRTSLRSLTLPALDANLAELLQPGRNYANLSHLKISVHPTGIDSIADLPGIDGGSWDERPREPLVPKLESLGLFLDKAKYPSGCTDAVVYARQLTNFGRALRLHEHLREQRPTLRLSRVDLRIEEGHDEMWLFRSVERDV